MIIERVYLRNYSSQHKKNISNIKEEINNLLENEFAHCSNMIRNIIITNDLPSTERKYGYTDLEPNACAITCKVGDRYDIVVNYNNAIFGENELLLADIKNYLYHEFQHVYDHKSYDDYIDMYVLQNDIETNAAYICEKFFREFNAAYFAQLYFQIVWVSNHYSLETSIAKYCEELRKIKRMIEVFQIDDTNKAEIEIQKITNTAYFFTKRLIYDLAIACGSNAADNTISYGEKKIGIRITGIDSQLDCILNEFIAGVNSVMCDNFELIRYSFETCMNPFGYISSLFKQKVQKLQLEK